MKTRQVLSSIILGVLGIALVFLPGRTVRADAGPKPSMRFVFVYDISPAPVVISGIQVECSTADCSDAAPLREMGPQGLICGQSGCHSLAYSYSEYHRLTVTFSDGTQRQSNVFTKKHYQATYRVRVRETSLLVTETGGSSQVGLVAAEIFMLIFRFSLNPGLLVTVVVELVVGLVYVLWRKRPWLSTLLTILLMNLLTQPVLWFLVKAFRPSLCMGVDILEAVVVLVEACILYLVLRKNVRFSETLLLSLAMNLASLGIGLLLPF